MHRSVLALAAKSVAGIGVAALFLASTAAPVSTVPVASAGSVDYYLKIDGIEGESVAEAHAGEIDVQSFSWGVSNAGSMAAGSGGGAGKATFQDITFTKRLDKSSPLIAKACASGQHIKEAKLTVRKAGDERKPEEPYTITLGDLTCTSLQQSGGGSDLPMESISFNYTKIEWSYVAPGSVPVKASWDLKKGTK